MECQSTKRSPPNSIYPLFDKTSFKFSPLLFYLGAGLAYGHFHWMHERGAIRLPCGLNDLACNFLA
jgi:hypothetical protein